MVGGRPSSVGVGAEAVRPPVTNPQKLVTATFLNPDKHLAHSTGWASDQVTNVSRSITTTL